MYIKEWEKLGTCYWWWPWRPWNLLNRQPSPLWPLPPFGAYLVTHLWGPTITRPCQGWSEVAHCPVHRLQGERRQSSDRWRGTSSHYKWQAASGDSLRSKRGQAGQTISHPHTSAHLVSSYHGAAKAQPPQASCCLVAGVWAGSPPCIPLSPCPTAGLPQAQPGQGLHTCCGDAQRWAWGAAWWPPGMPRYIYSMLSVCLSLLSNSPTKEEAHFCSRPRGWWQSWPHGLGLGSSTGEGWGLGFIMYFIGPRNETFFYIYFIPWNTTGNTMCQCNMCVVLLLLS